MGTSLPTYPRKRVGANSTVDSKTNTRPACTGEWWFVGRRRSNRRRDESQRCDHHLREAGPCPVPDALGPAKTAARARNAWNQTTRPGPEDADVSDQVDAPARGVFVRAHLNARRYPNWVKEADCKSVTKTRCRFESCSAHTASPRSGVGEFGRPRRAHNPKIVGSNPTPATRPSPARTTSRQAPGGRQTAP